MKSTKQVTSKRRKSIKQVISIEDLPPEMISELFEYLHPKDLVACSLVNRRWHSIYAAFKLHRLVAMDYNHYYCYLFNLIFKWYNTNQRIKEIERCGPAIFYRLKKKPLLSNLKQLALSGQRFVSELNELNRFQQLMQLEIKISLRNTKLHLKLPRLRVLVFHYSNGCCALSIDCPELSTLVYSGEEKDANLLKVEHPETIRKLETNLVGSKLTEFKNVECLRTSRFHMISKATLLSLPKLRELRYDRDIEDFFLIEFRDEFGSIDQMKRTLSELVDEAKRLRGRDLQFTFCGFQLTNVKLDQIDFGVKVDEEYKAVRNEYVYLKNYHLIELGALPFFYALDYSRLLVHVTGEFPRCFSQKFTGIHLVQARDVIENPDHLLRFLKSLGSVERLELETAGLSQEFYDQLPTSAPSLVKLELRGDWRNRLQLNFEFIKEFSCLSNLKIQPLLSLESSTSLAKSLSGECTIVVEVKIERPHVQPNEIDIKIIKIWNNKDWYIFKANKFTFGAKNPKEIVHFFERLQSSE